LGAKFGGQGALVAFAGLVVLGAVPVNAIGVVRLRRLQAAGTKRSAPETGALKAALRNPAFWAISAIFGLNYLSHSVS